MHPDLDKKARDVQLQQAKGHDVRAKEREFVVGDLVYAQNYGQGPKWLPGEIVEKHGSTLFTVQLKDGRKARKHTDQLMARATDAGVADKDPGTPDDNDVLEYPAKEDTDQSDTDVEPPESTEPPEQSDAGEQVATPEDGQSNPDQDHDANDDIDENAEIVERQNVPGPRRSGRSRNPPDRYG